MDNLITYIRTPLYLEIALLFDLKTTLKSFIQIYASIIACFVSLSGNDILRKLKAFTVLASFTLLRYLHCARMYHSLKVQSLVKLYLLFNVLELAEKLIGTLVNDIAQAIAKKLDKNKDENHTILDDESIIISRTSVVNSTNSNENNTDIKICGETSHTQHLTSGNEKNAYFSRECPSESNISTDIAVNCEIECETETARCRGIAHHVMNFAAIAILIFFFIFSTVLHTLVLYFQYLIIQLSLNSSSSVLYSLVISNQFLELKGNVTKKGDKKILFSLIDHDGTKRFNLLVYLIISFLSVYIESEKLAFTEFIYPIVVVMVFKILADWIKHAFFCRYNHLSCKLYVDYKNEYVKGNNFVGHNVLMIWMFYNLLETSYFRFLSIFLCCMHLINAVF